jgi:hypothetical protein
MNDQAVGTQSSFGKARALERFVACKAAKLTEVYSVSMKRPLAGYYPRYTNACRSIATADGNWSVGHALSQNAGRQSAKTAHGRAAEKQSSRCHYPFETSDRTCAKPTKRQSMAQEMPIVLRSA